VRSLGGRLSFAGASEPAYSTASIEMTPAAHPRVLLRRERSGRAYLGFKLWERAAPRGLGLFLSGSLLLAASTFGALRGGHYQAFVASEGGIGNFIARNVGLDVKAVTISGLTRLGEREVLDLAGVSSKSSMLFFDVDTARAQLEKAPLVASASIRKLYPGRIFMDIVERSPAALWQRDGEVSIVAADGAALDALRDERLNDLPFVVGDGANKRLKEYLSLLDAAQELRSKIEAGVFVAQRRWNLRMKSGVDVKLPETDPALAVATLVKLERDSRILERDIITLDLREPGRAFARLSADAADARAEKFAAKPKKGEKT
jgi:cell division protein FtsQ